MPQTIMCERVHDLLQSQRCHFVLTNPDCLSNMNLMNYLSWHYCYVDERNRFNAFWSVLAMTVIAIYVFWMMQFTIIHYFCPCLKVIADTCRLSQNLAGVTILTVANGSPDLFTSIAAGLKTNKSAFLACMSQAMFLHMFVAGMVMLTKPFTMEPNYYLRDFGFLFLNVAYMDFMFKRPEGISWWVALPATFIFVGYVLVAIVDQHLLKARIRKLERNRDSIVADEQLEELKPQADLPLNREVIDRSVKRKGGRNRKLFKQFWHSIYKFDKDRFRRGTVMIKIYLMAQLPIEMLLRLLIPVVDVEKPLFNWSKLLFCVHMLLVPTYICYIILRGDKVLGITFYTLTFIIMIPVTLIVFWLTRTDTPPRFFRYTSGMGFLAVVFLIYWLLAEVNAMFYTLATVVNMSQDFALATVICWALSSNDLFTNLLLAKQGWSNMAFTATFSAPVFGSFVFLALPFTLESFLKAPKTVKVSEGKFGETVCILLEVGLAFSLLSSLSTNFRMRRACGFLLVTYYLLFLVFLFLLEFDVIQAYGY